LANPNPYGPAKVKSENLTEFSDAKNLYTILNQIGVKARSNPKLIMKLNDVYLHKLLDTENYNNLYNNYLLNVAEKGIRLLTSSLFIVFHSLLRNFSYH
jgi:hypothetical protein